MQTFTVTGRYRQCKVITGSRFGDVLGHMPSGDVFIITDKHVHNLYGKAFPAVPAFVMEPGEGSKTADTAFDICKRLLEAGAGRDTFVLGIGGGVVCDMAGFVASVYMRGIDFGFVATSLMAQVDAAIGGKNGVNLEGYKNIIGTFNQPHFVLCDPAMLHTLPAIEIKNGLAEVVKHCLIDGKGLFYKMLYAPEAVLKPESILLAKLIEHSVRVKTGIVNSDERECGDRRRLNLGHTWGHAVEKTDGIPHGQAVSIGLAFAAGLSEHRGLLTAAERKDVVTLLQALGLPTKIKTKASTIIQHILKDKKKAGEHIHFVLMNGIGNVTIEPITYSELTEFAKMHG